MSSFLSVLGARGRSVGVSPSVQAQRRRLGPRGPMVGTNVHLMEIYSKRRWKLCLYFLWEENMGTILCRTFTMIQFWKLSFRGKYKEFRTRIWTQKSPKFIEKIQNCKIHRKTSSFRSLNNLVEKYKVHRSIQLVEIGFAAFFRIKNNIILRKLRPKTVYVQK